MFPLNRLSILSKHISLNASFLANFRGQCVSRSFGTSSFAKQASVVITSPVTTVSFEDGRQSRFHNQWLRDHCRCEKCIHPVTFQRVIDPLEAKENLAPRKYTIRENNLELEWENDEHKTILPLPWLQRNAYDRETPVKKESIGPKTWGAELKGKIPTVPYEKVMQTEEGLLEWLKNIERYGLGLVDGVPANGKATEEVIKRIGPLRETHYGAFWEFTSGFAHGDLAYSTVSLPAHTDNTYYTDPAGLQLFHLLAFDGVGGEQVYVDGFNAAKQLKDLDPKAYKTLSTLGTWANQAGDKDIFLRPSPHPYPVLNHDKEGNLYQIRYNNEDRSAINNLSFDQVSEYYSAINKWIKLVRSPKNELIVPLKPGMLIALDNWRVMHARKTYQGSRTLSGGYVDRDYWTSKLRVLDSSVKGKDARHELL